MNKMSFFLAPIAPVRDAQGRTVTKASMIPASTATLDQVYRFIRYNEKLKRLTEQVRSAPDFGTAKKERLPFVTPCGTFGMRKSEGLIALSGLFPIDVDKLESAEEAADLRRRIFADPYLDVRLAFVSPGGKGVKAFVPYPVGRIRNPAEEVPVFIRQAMDYVHLMYDRPGEGKDRGVDVSGKDLARACFLCHDSGVAYKGGGLSRPNTSAGNTKFVTPDL